ncbi:MULTISPECIES: cytochrome c oxidase assembly protein [Streptacidiphilus]|uniref:Cytochrome c oxidase assembly protein n=1 Tax=Streptacidiphilus cavernicola TaxID=3342716 RepID=A0ABV6UUH3_9ACTN|nr:cytochrome c oxidase assembly protein [Streptacidiphilus jeojiense]
MGDMPGMPGMGHDLPPLTLGRALALDPSADWPFVVGCALMLGLYLAGVVRLRRRGDSWPLGRTVAWVLGTLTVAVVTCTRLDAYGMQLLSAHMLQHMVLSMLSPIILLLGAPITLALRALPAAKGPFSPRDLLVSLLHSRYVKVVSHPAFTIPLFIASLYGLYFTPLFDFLMRSQAGHTLMMVHFLGVGLLFFWPIMGVDPGPHRPGHLMRMLELFIGMPFHAFFGVAVMMASGLMVTSYAHPMASLHVDPLTDQHLAGGLAWAFSEIPTFIVLIALTFQWAKSEERVSRRKDRTADRDGDAELNAYNAYLASLERRSA